MMPFRLRARFLISHLFLLAITLIVMILASFIFLATQPVSPSSTYERMVSLMREFIAANQAATSDSTRPLARLLEFQTQIQDFVATNEVRALIVNLSSNSVRYDSAGQFSRGDTLTTTLEPYTLPAYLRRGLAANIEPVFGGFTNANGVRWAFAGLSGIRQGEENLSVLLADSLPGQSLQNVIATFPQEFIIIFIQAAIIGLLVAVILAGFISRNLARSLGQLAQAATAVAEGHYDQRIPVQGASEVREVAQAFNRMSAEIHNTRQAQQDFMANVSHDLKTPLTSIQGYSQAIMDGAAKDPASAAKIIHEEAGRLNRMVTELTDLARLQAGRLSMHSTAIDMGKLATAIGQRLSILAQERGLILHQQTPSMPEIAGDGDRLAQVLTNLVSNAIKYTPKGGEIWLTTHINNGGVEVVVRDTGVGIAPDDLPRVFERFYQVDKTRGPRRGTGLGLAITQEIVQAHGGRITVTSAGVGQGSTFTVWLPSPQLTTIVRGKR